MGLKKLAVLAVAAGAVYAYAGPVITSAPPAGQASASAAAPAPGTAQAIAYGMMGSFGFSRSQFGCLRLLWDEESGWRWDAVNSSSGAYGIPQALPAGKMASAGADWRTNPATQVKWGLGYIKGVYGNPCNAWHFETSHTPNWY